MPSIPLVPMLVAFVLVLIATLFDLKKREIPDTISVLLLVWAIAGKSLGWIDVSWVSMGVGAAVGFALGAILFALGGLGGGDVKLVAALGAAIGIGDLLTTLFWMAIAGGVLAIVAGLRGEKELAYVPAIAAGLLVTLILDGEIARVFAA